MKTTRLLSAGISVVALAAALGCAGVGNGSEQSLFFQATGVAFLEGTGADVGEAVGDWDTTVEATGYALPAANAVTAAHKEHTALEGARFVALARLAEKLHGIHVVRESEVRDMTFASEKIQGQLAGDLTGVRVVKSAYDPEVGIAEVTVMVGLDSKGNIVPDRLLPIVPLSVAVRRAHAEQAAHLDALVKLREQLGEVEVGQEVRVKNLQLSHQRAWQFVEGSILQGVKFGEPIWPSDIECNVEATLRLTPADLERLQAMVGPIR